MHHPKSERRDSKTIVVVDEDCGVPTSIVESYRSFQDNGPLAQLDPEGLLMSMSEYDKPQTYDVYDYQSATRPGHGQDYTTYGPHSAYSPYPEQHVATQAQVPSGLPSALSLVPGAQQYTGAHDPVASRYEPYAQHPAYLHTAPRPRPVITSITPNQGQQGTRVTVYFQAAYDLDCPPTQAFLMFGTNKCQSVLQKTAQHDQGFCYSMAAYAPPLQSTNSPSPVPLHLIFDDSLISWDSPELGIGNFTYLDAPTPIYYSGDSPQTTSKKRKLSPTTSPHRSPSKKSSIPQLGPFSQTQSSAYTQSGAALPNTLSPFRRPSLPDSYSRRFSGPDYPLPSYNAAVPTAQQYYGAQTTSTFQHGQSPSWTFKQATQSSAKSPSNATMSGSARPSSMIPSPAATSNPPLVRTSTLQSPTTPGTGSSAPSPFNPYTVYPANAKAQLQIKGDLNKMTDNWTDEEWKAGRRLVQFRRTQSGNVIEATFEPVTPEERIPNSICVSCIWWAEKRLCYVTSVDTISLLESLVAVRFTVEEKNRIRRNLEGFRPETVSKVKADSEDFFKLVMGFPNPKPRNIEKDVKVFPWRILATALKKIIGKYSASYSSTAGLLQSAAGPGYTAHPGPDAGIDHQHRAAVSPRSTSSSTTSHAAHGYPSAVLPTNAYSPAHGHIGTPVTAAGGLGLGPSAGPPDLRLAVPGSTASSTTLPSWHQPSTHYSSDLSSSATLRTPSTGTWDFGGNYLHGSAVSPATGLPSSAQAYDYQPARFSTLTGQSTMPTEHTRFVPLQYYGDQSQPTSMP
ncbi:hypothetical protein KC363_g5727 [Hortaea werneckii]|nr:hypothetical protein KC363_g5727 [Hortaea werneckii]